MGYEKVKVYAAIADETAEQITSSHVKWTAFLTTASRLYKYPYQEQLMIYAQRPDATACADYDLVEPENAPVHPARFQGHRPP